MKPFFIAYILPCFLVLLSCSNNEPAQNERTSTDSVNRVSPLYKNALEFGSTEGVVGSFYIPEMLTLCYADSAEIEKLGARLSDDFSKLSAEIDAIGAEANGPLGQIKYNNDPKNVKFECLALIKKIPAKQPAFGKIVVLEATAVLVYNYFGPYEQLHTAYTKIRTYLKDHSLESNGPMREFYITTPAKDIDPKDYLTRILVPVKTTGTI